MKNKLAALSLLLVGFFPQPAVAQIRKQTALVDLTVSVFNDAGVSPSVLSRAQDRATFIMRRAGLFLVWLDCGTPGNRQTNTGCSAISFPEHLSVRLVATASTATEDTFGQTFQNTAGDGNYALVYFRVLASSNAAESVKTGELLGYVVAHELGHLLLGRDSHSATGLMTAVWGAAELQQASQGKLLFTSDQGDRIRSRYFAASARLKKTSEPLQAGSGH